jgi:CheY-like chemotaxis protein
MMDQILLNLTVNARDAMPAGGQIIIETSAVEFDEVAATQIARARPGSFVCLSVSDTGCGIPPENLPRIFEPFFTTKDVGKGTGLGLATVFGIVQQHQGWINVYSEVGRGTTVRVYLPRQTKPSDTEFFWSPTAAIRGGKETILLVEDESPVRAAMQVTLSRLGYRVLEAATGAAALAVWKEHHDEIHLLLTDLLMPGGMNGKALAEQLLQENPKLKVIYTSGYSVEVAGQDLRLEDGVNFLAKPFQTDKLAQTIRKRLDQK